MPKERGVLLSGAGENEKVFAKLSENEELFNQIAEFLFDEAGPSFGFKNLDFAKRDLIAGLRVLKKNNPSFGLRDLLIYMLETKDESIESRKAEAEEKKRMAEALTRHFKSVINMQNEQAIFSELGRYASIVDSVGVNKGKKNEEILN